MRDPLTLLGKPYKLGGISPDEGFDCWTLVEYVRRECFSRPTPLSAGDTNIATDEETAVRVILHAQALKVWHRIDAPGPPGSVVAMSLDSHQPLHHVGVNLDAGILHAWSGFGRASVGSVVLTPWSRIERLFHRVEVYECRS